MNKNNLYTNNTFKWKKQGSDNKYMSRKSIIILCIVLTISITGGLAFFIGRAYKKNELKKNSLKNNTYNIMSETNIKNTIETSNRDNEKVSPLATLKMTQFYEECGHTIINEYKVPSAVVNMDKESVEKYYSGWNLEFFSKDCIKLYKVNSGMCKEHYVVKDVNGYVNVYAKDENGEEELFRATDILTKYLSDRDKNSLKIGIEVVGKNNLETALEDFQ